MKQQIRLCTTADGVRVAYATCGGGPPLVKTANWPTHLDLERSNPVWEHWLAAHSRSHRLVRYDPRGSGPSDREVRTFYLGTWVCDLEAVVDVRGTLAADMQVPVGFKRMRCRVELRAAPGTDAELAIRLLSGTERSFVVLQTLQHGTKVKLERQVEEVTES